jgi:hypothetical protein
LNLSDEPQTVRSSQRRDHPRRYRTHYCRGVYPDDFFPPFAEAFRLGLLLAALLGMRVQVRPPPLWNRPSKIGTQSDLTVGRMGDAGEMLDAQAIAVRSETDAACGEAFE